MTEPSRRLRAIDNSLLRARRELPALATLFDAFGPLLRAQAELSESAPGWRGALPVVDPERFSQGAYVLAETGFQDMGEDLPAAAEALLPVIAASFPALAEAVARLRQALESGEITPGDLSAAAFGAQIALRGVEPGAAGFIAMELVRPLLRRQAQDLLALTGGLPWRQSFCPVCGAQPDMSVLRRVEEDNEFIKSHGGRRFLRCSCCASEWTHKRVSCPACGCEEPDELLILRAPDREFERADACTRCKAFVSCLDTGELAEAPDPDVSALCMLPLETQARNQGFVPLALHPWSVL